MKLINVFINLFVEKWKDWEIKKLKKYMDKCKLLDYQVKLVGLKCLYRQQ